ncbi:hypothetical protein [Epilithonimonas sp.]|uniref:hypothetical protein n=1 Tax=Epilithonimonas sp. TaxID=2894511 RepID=UPI003917201B
MNYKNIREEELKNKIGADGFVNSQQKVDTNFDNAAMLQILKKLGYTYCGEVYLAGSERKAFEKLL